MLRENHLTIDPFTEDIEQISDLIDTYVEDAEHRVKYYKSELTSTQFKFEELKIKTAKLEQNLNRKIDDHLTALEQYNLVLNQRDIIAKDNREMFAQINTKVKSYEDCKTLLESNTNAIIAGPKPAWVKYGLGYEDMVKEFSNSTKEPKIKPETPYVDKSLFTGEDEGCEEIVSCSPIDTTSSSSSNEKSESPVKTSVNTYASLIVSDGEKSELLSQPISNQNTTPPSNNVTLEENLKF
ncbi:hypothetical protein E9993_23205, partial [Labilibacter sediminis]